MKKIILLIFLALPVALFSQDKGKVPKLSAVNAPDGWGTDTTRHDATLTGQGTAVSPLKVDTTVTATAYQVDTAKVNLRSEIAGAGDDWGTDVVNSDATLTGNGTTGTPLKVDTTVIATKAYVDQETAGGGGGGPTVDEGSWWPSYSTTSGDTLYSIKHGHYRRVTDGAEDWVSFEVKFRVAFRAATTKAIWEVSLPVASNFDDQDGDVIGYATLYHSDGFEYSYWDKGFRKLEANTATDKFQVDIQNPGITTHPFNRYWIVLVGSYKVK